MSRFFGRLTYDGYTQTSADDFGDLPKGYAFFGHAVIIGPCSPFFQSEPQPAQAEIEAVQSWINTGARADLKGADPKLSGADERVPPPVPPTSK